MSFYQINLTNVCVGTINGNSKKIPLRLVVSTIFKNNPPKQEKLHIIILMTSVFGEEICFVNKTFNWNFAQIKLIFCLCKGFRMKHASNVPAKLMNFSKKKDLHILPIKISSIKKQNNLFLLEKSSCYFSPRFPSETRFD